MNRLLFAVLFLICSVVNAQYLETYRNSQLRARPEAGAQKIPGTSFQVGEYLEVLDSARQINGYYHAQIPGTMVDGWIYRSLVRLVPGQLPKFRDDEISTDVYVVDVGAGLGCIIRTPTGKLIVYDGGNTGKMKDFLDDISEDRDTLELVVVSHMDLDHWRAIDDIAENYIIRKGLYTSYRPKDPLGSELTGIVETFVTKALTIQDVNIEPMTPLETIYDQDGVKLTFLSGFGERDTSKFARELGTDATLLRNAASIVIRLDYEGRSILFPGDIVGMEDCSKSTCTSDNGCNTDCISTEKYLLNNLKYELKADVIMAPHHGARDASCPDFINAVSPTWVIFSAGNSHKHPQQFTAFNYIDAGVPEDNILRTDLGMVKKEKPNEGNPCNDEWVGANKGRTDKDVSFDDHIRIQITERGRLFVGYLN